MLHTNEHLERFFPVTQIDVVWFPEGAGGDRFEEKIFQDPLGRITRDAINFIQRNYLKETIIKHPQRAEAERFWNFPQAAIEEAVVNAIYHRSYEIREPVEIRISREDLVVLSFPGPDRSIAGRFEKGQGRVPPLPQPPNRGIPQGTRSDGVARSGFPRSSKPWQKMARPRRTLRPTRSAAIS